MTTMPRVWRSWCGYREVRVKSREAMLVRSLIGARTQLLGIVTELSNQIRGLMKTLVDLHPIWRTPLLAHAAKAVTSNWAGLR